MMDYLQSFRGWFLRVLVVSVLRLHPAWIRRHSLRLGDQLTVMGLLAVSGGIAAVAVALENGAGRERVEFDRVPRLAFDGRVSVNDSRWPSFCILPGVGETLARRIEQERNKRGAFRSTNELSRVAGLGRRSVVQMEPWIDLRAVNSTAPPRGY